MLSYPVVQGQRSATAGSTTNSSRRASQARQARATAHLQAAAQAHSRRQQAAAAGRVGKCQPAHVCPPAALACRGRSRRQQLVNMQQEEEHMSARGRAWGPPSKHLFCLVVTNQPAECTLDRMHASHSCTQTLTAAPKHAQPHPNAHSRMQHTHWGRCRARAGRPLRPQCGSAAPPPRCGLQVGVWALHGGRWVLHLVAQPYHLAPKHTHTGRPFMIRQPCRLSSCACPQTTVRKRPCPQRKAHLGSTRAAPARTTALDPAQQARQSRRPRAAATCGGRECMEG